jgi:predicted TIM-barrel fold metal-dependent hydrolase
MPDSTRSLEYSVFDADNHYYEVGDSFTRHLDPRMAQRAVQWVEIDGRQHHLVAGRLSHAVKNPTFDPISKPGALHDFVRGEDDLDVAALMARLRDHEPSPAHYREPEARLAVMDRQGLEWTWLFPTLGVLYEELLKKDIGAVTATFQAFNRWLAEDWGFAYAGRIFAAPYLSLADVDWAVRELEWALAQGARVVCMRPAAVHTAQGPLSPGHADFDPFWARVNEAGITVAIHAGDSGYSTQGYAQDGFSAAFGEGATGAEHRPSIKMWNIERAALDYLATLIFDRVFERFPNLRVASIENGSEFLPDLMRKLGSMSRKAPGYFKQDPAETFRSHIWINPFWEDDVAEVARYMGPDHVIFGSDWPHVEGLPAPLDTLSELEDFSDADRRKILRENALDLTGLPVS